MAQAARRNWKGETQLRYQQVYQYVVDLIAEHDLQAGDKLPSASDLTARTGVSMISVRRALTELENEGVRISTLRDVVRRLPGRILGIDAGGSGTRVVLLENGTATVRAPGPPMNALLTDCYAGHLRRIIEAADATAAGIGMPGIRLPGQARDLSVELTRQTGCPVYVTGDADSARAGAFLGGPGMVVIAGTGSMASGWNGQSSARAGGHGFLLGDEGSAYWIGRAAVRAALRFQDQTGGSELIHRAVTRAAGQGLDALIGDICTHPAERDRLTALAPAVTALAAEDAEASRIALEAAGHLADLAESIQRRLGPLPVAGAGGVFRAPVIWDRFAELTGAVRPAASGAVGAALLAGRA